MNGEKINLNSSENAAEWGSFIGYDAPIDTQPSAEQPLEIEPKEESPREVFATFEIASGLTKEDEFKRLTGEDWPGVNFVAESVGVDDDGYDEPIEHWTIYRIGTPSEPTTAEPSESFTPESLAPEAKQYYDDEMLNIDDMLKSRYLTPEKAEKYRQEVTERSIKMSEDSQAQPETPEESQPAGEQPEAPAPTEIDIDTIEAEQRRLEELEGEAAEVERSLLALDEARLENINAELEQIDAELKALNSDSISREEGLTEENSAEFANWWNSLSTDAKEAVKAYESAGYKYGRGLRAWLQLQGIIEPGR